MSPGTHFFMSWIIAAKTTDNRRDCGLVTLAGVLPDLDGLGIIPDAITRALGYRESVYYEHYHHFLLHGLFGGVLIAVLMAGFARHRWQVLLLSLLVFHLHLLCDLVGSRGPDPDDLWPIFYDGPFKKNWMWIWKGQWRLDSWFNEILSVVLLVWALRISVQQGWSFVAMFNRRWDEKFVAVLRQWSAAWKVRHAGPK
jgi:inner membrane protein